MARTSPHSRAYALENAAFLRALRRTGNAHEAARAMDASRTRFTKRRAADPAFAARWDAALVIAQAALSETPALAKPTASAPRSSFDQDRDPVLVRRRDGTAQIRRRLPTAIAPADEQRFLFALAATCNVRLSARAAGFASASFYARKRARPAFADQWRDALARGYERVAAALLEGWKDQGPDVYATFPHDGAQPRYAYDDSHVDGAWAHNAPPPLPPMTVDQAMQLLHLHQKEARAFESPEPLRRRRGESREARSVRLTLMYRAWEERSREAFRIGEAARAARRQRSSRDDAPDPHEPPRPDLPDLAQVTGWSKADPAKVPHDEKRALFGGWRIGDWRKKER